VKRVSADGYWSNHWMKSPMGFGNVNPRPSADMLFTQFFKSDAPWNGSAWKNPRFDQLLVLARAETDEANAASCMRTCRCWCTRTAASASRSSSTSSKGPQQARSRAPSSHPLGSFMGYTCTEQAWLDA
jgi:peptide/nickel transport system substrate-binding protein